jgi:hypothetical protein
MQLFWEYCAIFDQSLIPVTVAMLQSITQAIGRTPGIIVSGRVKGFALDPGSDKCR